MSETDITDELLGVAQAAAQAGADVLSRRNTAELNAINKSGDGDWVTSFDIAAEEAVRGVITAARPDDAITGEELGTSLADNFSGIRWSIDPLDGTTNFIRNIVYYCTSVAACDADGNWLAGVVNAPALRRTYWATRGGGAWLNENGTTRRLPGPVLARKGGILGTGFSYDEDTRAEQVKDFLPMMRGLSDMRRLGSAALDLCMIADATLDAYGERGLNEHDWAAGALIAEESGAWVHRPKLASPLDGGPAEQDRLAAWVAASATDLSERFPL